MKGAKISRLVRYTIAGVSSKCQNLQRVEPRSVLSFSASTIFICRHTHTPFEVLPCSAGVWALRTHCRAGQPGDLLGRTQLVPATLQGDTLPSTHSLFYQSANHDILCGYGHPRLKGGFYVWRERQIVLLESGETEMPLRLDLAYPVSGSRCGSRSISCGHTILSWQYRRRFQRSLCRQFCQSLPDRSWTYCLPHHPNFTTPDLGDRIQRLPVLSKNHLL